MKVNCPSGAFYMTVMFEEGVLNDRQTLKIENDAIRQMVEGLVAEAPNDRRFVDAVIKAKPAAAKGLYIKKVTLTSTMGQGVRVNVSSIN